MCGLVGYVGRVPPVDAARLQRMRETLAHRGPDDADTYITHAPDPDGGVAVGLAHRRLSVIDTRDVGRQPMVDASGALWIVFNGEIYNFPVLRERLVARGHRFRTRTDTEVLLHLYRDRGEAMLDELVGMFAFALWDSRDRSLLLARDRVGKKPLFLAEPVGDPRTLLFASEVKALLASGVVDDALDPQAAHDYLGLCYLPGPQTALRGVRQLPPGHALRWRAGKTRTWRYWTPRFATTPRGPTRPSFAQAADEVLTGLRGAVARRMIADVPLGMFLSGGIDSTAVLLCMAEASRRQGGPAVQAFTVQFEEESFDETPFARVAARHFGAEHHVERVRPDVDVFLGPLTETMDQPYADSSAIPLWYLCRLARQHVTVALGGDGGDELYAGYRTHFAWRLANYYRRLPGAVRDRLVPALVARLPVSHAKMSFDLKARAFVRAAAQPPADAHYAFKEFLSEDARRALARDPGAAPDATARHFHAAFARHPEARGLNAVLACDTEVYLPDDILVKVDRMSMAHSLEARSPFLDHQLIEHAARLPVEYKLRGLSTKAVLKRALRGRVPEGLLRRRKAGFNVPMAAWLCGPLRPLARDLLCPGAVSRLGLWRPEQVTALLDAHEARRADHSRTLWALLCFMLFNQRFRQGRAA